MCLKVIPSWWFVSFCRVLVRLPLRGFPSHVWWQYFVDFRQFTMLTRLIDVDICWLRTHSDSVDIPSSREICFGGPGFRRSNLPNHSRGQIFKVGFESLGPVMLVSCWCHCSNPYWLMVWNMCYYFHNIWDNPSNWLIFFRGLGIPPTRNLIAFCRCQVGPLLSAACWLAHRLFVAEAQNMLRRNCHVSCGWYPPCSTPKIRLKKSTRFGTW